MVNPHLWGWISTRPLGDGLDMDLRLGSLVSASLLGRHVQDGLGPTPTLTVSENFYL
jgi:hypothetical protein